MEKLTPKQVAHLNYLQRGCVIRLVDGRTEHNGFADLDVLKQLIDSEYAEVFDNQGLKFVRITSNGDTIIRRHNADPNLY